MNIKSLILGAVTALSLVGAAQALTLGQAMQEVAGYHCAGSSCSQSATTQNTVDNPDIVTSSEVLVSPATESSPRDYSGLATWCPMISTMDGGKTYPSNVNADCVAQSLNPGRGGQSAVYRTVVTTEDGGTSVVDICTTTTKTLTYNGPFTSRDTAWSVDTSTSSC